MRDIENNKMAWRKEGKQYEHFVLAFPPNRNQHSAEEILQVTSEIVDTVYPEFMAVISVHTDSLILHSHVVLDALNAVTGKKFSQGPGDLNRVKQKTNSMLQTAGFEIIRMSANDFVDHTDYSHTEGFDFLELDESDLFPDTELISEADMEIIDSEVALFTEDEICEINNHLKRFSSYRGKYNGGNYPMARNNQNTLSTPQEPAVPATQCNQEFVPTMNGILSNGYPATVVASGSIFRVHATDDTDLSAFVDLAFQSAPFYQEHQHEDANRALAMQYAAQDSGHPTNVILFNGNIFDIDFRNDEDNT